LSDVSATRLLVLGVVRGYGRAHGYLIGNDLLAWEADRWANVKWGSIYHALSALTRSGSLVDHAGPRGRTEYELTERGEAEFLGLLRGALRTPDPRPDRLGAALALLPALSRAEAVALLTERRDAVEDACRDAERRRDAWTEPPHVRELYGRWAADAAADAEWCRGLIARLEQGEYPMAGEPGSPGRPGSWPRLIESER
jgi:DNA-binding PadR family transcriptional regulator